MPTVVPEIAAEPGELNLRLRQGQTATHQQRWKNQQIDENPPDPLNLTGYEIRVSISAADTKGNPIGDVLLALSTDGPTDGGSTVTITDPVNGIVDIKLTDEDTASLPIWEYRETDTGTIDKRGIWDEELQDPAGNVPLVLQGRVSVKPEVSK